MSRVMALVLALWLVCSTTACFITSTANVSSSPAQDPTSARIGQINKELAGIEAQTAKLQSDRNVCEAQRNESLVELGKLTGMGPKVPSPQAGEDLYLDPGMMISMHNQNVTFALNEMKKIDAQMAALAQQAATLKAERSQLEQVAATSSKTPAGPGGCFTPDTRVLMAHGTKSIAAVTAGEQVAVYDEAAGRLDYRSVLKVFQAREDHYFLLNNDVRATALHRFLTEAGWVRAADLEAGMRLNTGSGWVTLESKKMIAADVEVFNMEVDEHHDFVVVGDRERYVVHNTGGGK